MLRACLLGLSLLALLLAACARFVSPGAPDAATTMDRLAADREAHEARGDLPRLDASAADGLLGGFHGTVDLGGGALTSAGGYDAFVAAYTR
jgi:hypothetical protein